ncbi:MAG TPA: alpha/beta fold hydrolase, partial [Exilispira sp.]|nr:alpha/beta fold hydrolase [Exilispira sp.]
MKNNYLTIQKELQKPIFFEDCFLQDNRQIYFSISSEKGLEYLDSGINGFHNYGIKKVNIKLKKKVESYDIFYQYWLTDPDSPSIFFLHGNAENSSTHPKFFHYFLSKNYNVFTFDHIGHGSSSGYRGILYDYSEYIETIIQIFQFYHNILKNSQNIKYKNKKVKTKEPTWILAGFSMGGLLAVDFINKMRNKNSKSYKKSDDFSNEYTFKKNKIDNNPLKNLSKGIIKSTNNPDSSNECDTSIYSSIKSLILLA